MRLAALIALLFVVLCASQAAFASDSRRTRVAERCTALTTELEGQRTKATGLRAMNLQDLALRLRLACEGRSLEIAGAGALEQRIEVLREAGRALRTNAVATRTR
jgi:hypothetical protein